MIVCLARVSEKTEGTTVGFRPSWFACYTPNPRGCLILLSPILLQPPRCRQLGPLQIALTYSTWVHVRTLDAASSALSASWAGRGGRGDLNTVAARPGDATPVNPRSLTRVKHSGPWPIRGWSRLTVPRSLHDRPVDVLGAAGPSVLDTEAILAVAIAGVAAVDGQGQPVRGHGLSRLGWWVIDSGRCTWGTSPARDREDNDEHRLTQTAGYWTRFRIWPYYWPSLIIFLAKHKGWREHIILRAFAYMTHIRRRPVDPKLGIGTNGDIRTTISSFLEINDWTFDDEPQRSRLDR